MVFPKTILSVTAHPDDEVLGFGGTAHKYSMLGSNVINCILCGSVTARKNKPTHDKLLSDLKSAQSALGCGDAMLGDFPNIKMNTVPHIELVQFIEAAIDKHQPDWIFTHHPNDINDDHFHVYKACLAASRLMQRRGGKSVSGIFLMEIPSSTDWSYAVVNNVFAPTMHVEIEKENLDAKLKALDCYSGVMRDYPHPRSVEAIEALAKCRGSANGCFYAESFVCAHLVA